MNINELPFKGVVARRSKRKPAYVIIAYTESRTL